MHGTVFVIAPTQQPYSIPSKEEIFEAFHKERLLPVDYVVPHDKKNEEEELQFFRKEFGAPERFKLKKLLPKSEEYAEQVKNKILSEVKKDSSSFWRIKFLTYDSACYFLFPIQEEGFELFPAFWLKEYIEQGWLNYDIEQEFEVVKTFDFHF